MRRNRTLYDTSGGSKMRQRGVVGLAVLLVSVVVPTSMGTAAPPPTSESGVESIDVESVVPGRDLWVYEAAGEKERHFCGSRALAAGREVLRQAKELAKGRPITLRRYTDDPTLYEGVSHGPYAVADNGLVLYARMVKPGRAELYMAYRARPVGLAGQIAQRQFLDRASTRSCRSHGPETVWHPPKNERFAEKIARRAIQNGASLLAPEYVYYDEADFEDPNPFVEPRVVELKASEKEGLLHWLATMIDPRTCEPCGRRQAGCLECDMGSECNSWQMVRFAPDANGRTRLQAIIVLAPPMVFGGAEETIRQLSAVLGIDEDRKLAPEDSSSKPTRTAPSPQPSIPQEPDRD